LCSVGVDFRTVSTKLVYLRSDQYAILSACPAPPSAIASSTNQTPENQNNRIEHHARTNLNLMIAQLQGCHQIRSFWSLWLAYTEEYLALMVLSNSLRLTCTLRLIIVRSSPGNSRLYREISSENGIRWFELAVAYLACSATMNALLAAVNWRLPGDGRDNGRP
jgi:hypothetical protein